MGDFLRFGFCGEGVFFFARRTYSSPLSMALGDGGTASSSMGERRVGVAGVVLVDSS